jgi:glycosyltransferase involved in cell wall biosynthesis
MANGRPSSSKVTVNMGHSIRVAVFPSDAGGCGHYRLRWSAAELQRQGHEISVREHLNAVWERHDDGDRLVDVKDLDFDVAVFQRVYRRSLLDLMRLLKAKGVALVMDVDDDLFALEPNHPTWHELDSREDDAWGVLREAVALVDLVTVSTPALAKRYGGAKARVIPNGIPRAYLGISTERRQLPVVGWTGLVATHPGDLNEVGSSIYDLCHSGKARFRAIGDRNALRLLNVPAQEFHPGAPLHTFEYAHLYADLDVAIVPLKPSRFNAGKSWLKMMEAAALGVPVVASPTPENVRLGVGLLAERPKDWRTHLSRLCGSADLRLSMAAQGRAVASEWTIEERIAPMVWDAWTSARSATVQKVTAQSTRL